MWINFLTVSIIYIQAPSLTNISDVKRVIAKEDLFDTLHRVHYIQIGHSGYKNTFEKVNLFIVCFVFVELHM